MNYKLNGPLLALCLIRKNYFTCSKLVPQSYRFIYSCGNSTKKPCKSLIGLSVNKAFSSVQSDQDFLRPHGILTTSKAFYCKKPVGQDDLNNENVQKKKLSIFQKFKAMYRDYWYVLVPVHLVTSAIWFGSFYYMARSGVDIASLAEMVHLSDETVDKIRKNSNTLAGHLAVSYLLYKIFTPLRYTVTVGGTTISINYLKKWGCIKPIPKKEEFKKMLEEKKVSFRKKRDNFRVKKDIMKKSVIEKLTQKKRPKKTNDIIRKVLHNRKITKNG